MSPRPSRRFARALDAPALHFAVIGLALFLARAYGSSVVTGDPQPARAAVVIDARRVAELRTGYVATVGRAPDADAESRMIQKEVDDELLYREALRLGLDRADRTVFWRLVEKMRFLGEARDGEDDDSLFRRALAIGLQSKDPVIRQVLIRKLGMLIRFAADEAPPTEAELRDYYERHPELYARPERVSFVHVFFSADRRGQRAQTDAERSLELVEGGAEAKSLGDPFLAGTVFTGQTRGALAKVFGADFADAVIHARLGSWQPMRSAYGAHLVKILERADAGRSPLAEVRSQVLEGVEQERRDARLRRKLAELRAQYDVRVEGQNA